MGDDGMNGRETRAELAKWFMDSMVENAAASGDHPLDDYEGGRRSGTLAEAFARDAVAYADALIAELAKPTAACPTCGKQRR